MIARVWHGYTKPEHANAYESMLKPELLPGISKVKGYHGSYLLRREIGAEVEFITITLECRFTSTSALVPSPSLAQEQSPAR